jgi:hypothetical protein
LVADFAEECVVMPPEEQAAAAAAVPDGVDGELSGDDDQSLELVVVGAEPVGVRGDGPAQHVEAVDVERLVEVNRIWP